MIYFWFKVLGHVSIKGQLFPQITGMFEEYFHIVSALVLKRSDRFLLSFDQI